ncbi:MAG: DUF1638 domain-containing protein [Phycisphaerae bacterium]
MARKKLMFIGCDVMYREACALAARSPHRVDLRFLPKSMHDDSDAMRRDIQEAVDAVDPEQGYHAILLGYGRCNDGVVGVCARQIPLVVPRAHDCITLFFGSREAFRENFESEPGTYYMTTGWYERSPGEGLEDQSGIKHLPLVESYDELVRKYGRDNADYIAETLGNWSQKYSRMLYLEMGVTDEEPIIASAQAEARGRGWRFERRKGDWTLLEKFFYGGWDENFVVVPAGGEIVSCNDDRILDVDLRFEQEAPEGEAH